ncbi:DUF4232 domain-containing protein [Streptomyces sp. CA-132043]|uniref:DUF4232 domain-containing protein n=1 Tax=Streptomyces sp. CA-132043 TaxID=3240048 RepID=UPI003D8A6F22
MRSTVASGGTDESASKGRAAGVGQCRGDQMLVTAVPRLARQQGDHLLVTASNEGSKPCWVTSYPAVKLGDVDTVLPHSKKDKRGGEEHITLQPGGKVYSAVNLFGYGSTHHTAQSFALALRGADGQAGPFYSVDAKGEKPQFSWMEADVLNWSTTKPYNFCPPAGHRPDRLPPGRYRVAPRHLDSAGRGRHVDGLVTQRCRCGRAGRHRGAGSVHSPRHHPGAAAQIQTPAYGARLRKASKEGEEVSIPLTDGLSRAQVVSRPLRRFPRRHRGAGPSGVAQGFAGGAADALMRGVGIVDGIVFASLVVVCGGILVVIEHNIWVCTTAVVQGAGERKLAEEFAKASGAA